MKPSIGSVHHVVCMASGWVATAVVVLVVGASERTVGGLELVNAVAVGLSGMSAGLRVETSCLGMVI